MQYFCVCFAIQPWLQHSVGYGSSSLQITSSPWSLIVLSWRPPSRVPSCQRFIAMSPANATESSSTKSNLSSYFLVLLSDCFSFQYSNIAFCVLISVGYSPDASISSSLCLASNFFQRINASSGIPSPERLAQLSVRAFLSLRSVFPDHKSYSLVKSSFIWQK